jgi:hypothetical protein
MTLLQIIASDYHIWYLQTFLKGGNQNPNIEEDQPTQWPKEKVQKDKQ